MGKAKNKTVLIDLSCSINAPTSKPPLDKAPSYKSQESNSGDDKKHEDVDDDLPTTTTTEQSPKKSDDEIAAKKDESPATPAESQAKFDRVCRTASENMTFAFGPSSSFFYEASEPFSSWQYRCLTLGNPPAVSTDIVGKWNMKKIYEVAFSPFGGAYVAYQSQSGGLSWQIIDIFESTRPKKKAAKKDFEAAVSAWYKLKEWLNRQLVNEQNIKSTRVRFGPAGRLMAWNASGACIKLDLPSGFETEMQTRKIKKVGLAFPVNLTFGVGNAWAAVWEDGAFSVDLDNNYEQLEQLLKSQPTAEVSNIVLDCCGTSNQYFVKFHPMQEQYLIDLTRMHVVSNQWKKRTEKMAIDTMATMVVKETRPTNQSVTLLTAKDAALAILNQPKLDEAEQKKQEKEALRLSVENAKKAREDSKDAKVLAGLALLAGCTIM